MSVKRGVGRWSGRKVRGVQASIQHVTLKAASCFSERTLVTYEFVHAPSLQRVSANGQPCLDSYFLCKTCWCWFHLSGVINNRDWGSSVLCIIIRGWVMEDSLQEGPRRSPRRFISCHCRTKQIDLKREDIYEYHHHRHYSLQKKNYWNAIQNFFFIILILSL